MSASSRMPSNVARWSAAALSPVLLGVLVLAPVDAAHAIGVKGKRPTVTSVAPMKLGVGELMTVRGTGFRTGPKGSTVMFQRVGGKAIFAKAKVVKPKRLQVVVPQAIFDQLPKKGAVAVATRFRITVLTTRFSGPATRLKASPLIGPGTKGRTQTPAQAAAASQAVAAATAAEAAATAPTAAPTASPEPTASPTSPSPDLAVAPPDCDADGIPDGSDTDDDNDLLTDAEEERLGTKPCGADSDGDGMSDGWEQLSAIDRNNEALPAPAKRTYPNALDGEDASLDQDGDGLANVHEYEAWRATGSPVAAADGDVYTSRLSYSGGDPNSAGRSVPADQQDYLSYADRDGNGFLTDLERDADGDRIPNMDEGGNREQAGFGYPAGLTYGDYGLFTSVYIGKVAEATKDAKCGGLNQVPHYCTDSATPTPVVVQRVDTLDWLVADSDGDGVRDDIDDVDHDDVSNYVEYRAELKERAGSRTFAQLDACQPASDSRFCLLSASDADRDGLANTVDDDDDDDRIGDLEERRIGTNSLLADTDGDRVSDGYEYQSAKDLNGGAPGSGVPYPIKRPYPNALDPADAKTDFDGDGMVLADEFRAWIYVGAPGVLNYSDGFAFTAGRGGPADDERDVDSDGLSNIDELSRHMQPAWWKQQYDGINADSFSISGLPVLELPYPSRTYLGTDFVDADTDGDGLLDGADDEDHDGFSNLFESVRPANWPSTYSSTKHPGSNARARVNPFNPCKPYNSDACHRTPPLNYYDRVEAYDSDGDGKDDATRILGEDWKSPVDRNGPS